MNWSEFPAWVQGEILAIFEELRSFDEDTYQHCLRVGRDTRLLAKACGLSLVSQVKMEWAGLFHDVGKARVRKDVLFKPDKLNEREYRQVQDHSLHSAKMIEPLTELPFFKEVQPMVLHHHERMDGRGYPYGLLHDEIPLGSRMILVADTFDAMTHSRSYRKALPEERAYGELNRCAGSQFDPRLVQIFCHYKPLFKSQSDSLEQQSLEISAFSKAA